GEDSPDLVGQGMDLKEDARSTVVGAWREILRKPGPVVAVDESAKPGAGEVRCGRGAECQIELLEEAVTVNPSERHQRRAQCTTGKRRRDEGRREAVVSAGQKLLAIAERPEPRQ